MKTGYELTKEFEAYRQYAYPDPSSDLARAVRSKRLKANWGFRPAWEILQELPADVAKLSGSPWTCGYGETKGVTPQTSWSRAEAEQRFSLRYEEFKSAVRAACTVPPTEEQLGAMTSLAYNIGLGWSGKVKPSGAKDGFRQSSVLKAHNRGDFAAATRAFALWNRANGREEPGLTRRRAAEASLYALGSEAAAGPAVEAVPAQVDAERPMARSEITRAGTIAGGTAVIATVAETARTVAEVKDATEDLGAWLVPILLIAVVGLCGYIVWQRWKQREGGWA